MDSREKALREALKLLASWPCDYYTTEDGCLNSHRTPDAEYGADRSCAPCVARAALAAEPEGEVAGYITLESGEIRTSTVKGQPTGTFELRRIPPESSTWLEPLSGPEEADRALAEIRQRARGEASTETCGGRGWLSHRSIVRTDGRGGVEGKADTRPCPGCSDCTGGDNG